MIKYIEPSLKSFETFDELDKYAESKYDFMTSQNEITIGELIKYKQAIILGEPGMGKTRLLREMAFKADSTGKKVMYIDLKSVRDSNITNYIISRSEERYYIKKDKSECGNVFCSKEFDIKSSDTKLFLDALDEVSKANLASITEQIRDLAYNYKLSSIYYSCRKNYFKNYPITIFDMPKYILINNISLEQVKQTLKNEVDDITLTLIDNIIDNFSWDIKCKLIQIPRYLNILIQLLKSNKQITNKKISRIQLFETFIYNKLNIEAAKDPVELSQTNELIKRILEKLALIMEIYQVNSITKDELMTFFDDIESNLSRTLLGKVSISTFYDRSLLKDNLDGTIQFENSEVQEYLAAKEISRLGHLQYVVYQLTIDPDIQEIYPSWYHTLSFTIELNPQLSLYIMKLLHKINNIEDDSDIHELILSANTTSLTDEQKREIFYKVRCIMKLNS